MKNSADTQVTNSKTIENNKLIAEFMGAKPIGGEYDLYGIIESIEDGEYEQHFFFGSEMKFSTDWNWLVSVVKKIELSYEYSVTICWEHCIISNAGENKDILRIEKDGQTKIESVYTAVIEFIKWYNLNK